MDKCSGEGCGLIKTYSLVGECLWEDDRDAVDLLAKRALCDRCMKQVGHSGRSKGCKKG